MDVSTWLRDLGLGDYAQAFQAHDIDAEVLPRLTADDLTALGITSVGHRRRLLDAITALNQERGPAAAEPTTVAARPLEAERRQLTVLFCDLVGSTELAARLDPEDLRGIMAAYQRCAATVLERFEGHVAKYLGDGVLAYFGWPVAHEHDAEQAVRAGLVLVEEIGRLEPQAAVSLQARVGIATGLVVVGDLIGNDEARERTVVGEVPNVAARLQALAAPGSVVISAATRRLVGGLFELNDLGPQRLKGFAEPVAAWLVEGEGRAESRFEALHGERLTPLVGREHELGILLERWAWAKDGDGQVVLLSGEPGIGKSRVIRALRERLGDEPCMLLSHYCSPYHTNSAFHPVIGLLERAARFDRDDPPNERLSKLEGVLARSTDRLDEVLPLLAALLGVPTGERYPALGLPAEVLKRRTLQALVDQLAGLAARQPVLAVYEDMHWVDPSTLELLGLVVERSQRLPVLVLITFRPEFQPPWTGQAHVTMLTMNRLGRKQGADLVAGVTGEKAVPVEIVEQIVARTDGVPLFVEELTKTILESGLLADAGDRYELSGPLPPLAIPANLHDSLMARLDRLAPVKEVAQIGAVIGREFSHELLAGVAPMSDNQLVDALEQLVQSELVFRRGTPPDAIYTFKHALVQDAAYQSLLKSRRQRLHGRIAQVLQEQLPTIAETTPEVLAHHSAAAGLVDDAVEWWARAARQSAARSAMAEAVVQARSGLELLARLPDDVSSARKELELQSVLAAALVATVGNAAAATGEAYVRARVLCEQLGDAATLVPVLSGLSTYHQTRSEFQALRQISAELLRLGHERGDTASEVVGHRSMALCLYHLGEFRSAQEHIERVLELYVPGAHHPITSIAAFDMRAAALSYLSLSLLILGHPEQARHWSEQALIWSRGLQHPHTLAFSLNYAGYFHLLGRAGSPVEEVLEELRCLAVEQRFPIWLAGADIMGGYVLAGGGEPAEGLRLARKGLTERRANGSSWHETYLLGLLAQIAHRAGQPDEAHNLLDTALAMADRTGERWYQAELHRVKGELPLAQGHPDQAAAEDCFRQAVAVARGQGARLWELRAATSLAQLWRDQGRRAEAHDLLAPVYGWFTEGFDTADLKDAKALLHELG